MTTMQGQAQQVVGDPRIPVGIAPILPLKDFPPGRCRIRMRKDETVVVFVKSPDGIRKFIPIEQDGHWIPFAEVGRNQTLEESARQPA